MFVFDGPRIIFLVDRDIIFFFSFVFRNYSFGRWLREDNFLYSWKEREIDRRAI